MIRALLAFLFPRSLRNRVPLLPDDYQVHILNDDRVRRGDFALDDYLVMGAGLARTPQQARRLRSQYGTPYGGSMADAWAIMRQVHRRKRRHIPAWKRLWGRLRRWLWN